jgi:hypothetical protein
MWQSIDWMKQNFGVDIDRSIGAASQRFTCGDATVLLMSASPTDGLKVRFELAEEEPAIQFQPQFEEQWQQLEQAVLREITPDDGGLPYDLWKAAPTALSLPLKDFPLTRIQYTKLRYSKVRSFHSLLNKNQELWSALAKNADYAPGAPIRPGILVVHLFLISEAVKGQPYLILAQRTNRQSSAVGYHGGNWSASIEEQLQFGADEKLADLKFEDAARRALAEELLGARAQEASLVVCALMLERKILNLAAAVACRTQISFAEIHQAWQVSEDRDEHTQIIAMPLTLSNVQECLQANAITERVRQQCVVHSDYQIVFEQNQVWQLHPTSALRLALAYGMVASA